jgi:hypothetical protein
MSAICCPKVSVYKPRKPEKTVFFQVIKKYYKTWVKKLNKMIKGFLPMFIGNFKALSNVGFSLTVLLAPIVRPVIVTFYSDFLAN